MDHDYTPYGPDWAKEVGKMSKTDIIENLLKPALQKIQSTPLTKDLLIENGWIEKGNDPSCFAEKPIENRNPLNASEDSDIKLIVHGMYNQNTFAVLLPDGGLLNFVANSLEELKQFENAIKFYDPPF